MTEQTTSPRLRGTVADILAAETVQAAWNSCADGLERLGFINLLYGATRVPTWGIIGDGQDALILYRGPQAYADVYLGEELYLNSPTYQWAEHHEGFVSWADAVTQNGAIPTPEQLKIVQLNIEHDCLAGFVGSLNHIVPGMRGVIGLSPGRKMMQPQADALWAEVGKDVEVLCQLLHLRVASLPQTPQRRPLTSRQREALSWCAQGKTMQDVATIMNLSIATVEKHLRLAREALDAQTTAHAVQKATSLNLLVGAI
ncbi:helix-turn-helix transcriptional regulator [Sulfitobacter aestuariivivens]|uniref:Autoinducer binding domain-containing protein n=1 Tax=Sulfitobacter aestuariivivens TaxID=2766981 RepID=A0A927D4F7_9RHOB|nr:LuxR family transcriptional regulator [Sulfitobacter aestuariivivens]MBD3663227.1 autoinducer binding domain-containing protein [Sulfitobacter aestuariivivens]